MAIYNLGSINIDHTYKMKTFPRAGETLSADQHSSGLGGKGANQSIAIARAGGEVFHIGAVGPQADDYVSMLSQAGVNTQNITTRNVPTGHAIINIDQSAENTIVLFEGANGKINRSQIENAFKTASEGDWLLLQNETNEGRYAAQQAKKWGLKVAYCAAPFDADAVAQILPYADLMTVNEIELAAIQETLPEQATGLSEVALLLTLGSAGAKYSDVDETLGMEAFKVDAVDTTGAGDTFLGYFLARLDQHEPVAKALQYASAAAALQVTRHGASQAIPELHEVEAFLGKQS